MVFPVWDYVLIRIIIHRKHYRQGSLEGEINFYYVNSIIIEYV